MCKWKIFQDNIASFTTVSCNCFVAKGRRNPLFKQIKCPRDHINLKKNQDAVIRGKEIDVIPLKTK